MNLEIVRPEPCGTCAQCKLAVEVRGMLEYIDRRFVPELERLAREITEAKWYGGRAALDSLSRSYRNWKAQWCDARERFLTPDVVNAMTCANQTLVFKTTFTEITVQPREKPSPVPSLIGERCLRCGARLEYTPPAVGVCAGCFGKEF